MSGVASRTSSGRPSAFESFVACGAFGRKSATAAAITTTSAVTARCRIAASISDGGLHPVDHDPKGHRPGGRRDQHHLGATPCGRLGDGMALLPRRAVGQVADRIDRLTGAAGRDDHLYAREVASSARPLAPSPESDLRRRSPTHRRRRPTPRSPPASRPDSGGTMTTTPRDAAPRGCGGPRGAPTSRCASPGRRRPGRSRRNKVAVRRSSAKPPA